MITPNWSERIPLTKSPCDELERCQAKLCAITENLFGFYCSETVNHSIQLHNIYKAISEVKANNSECTIKLFCLIKLSAEISKLCDENVMVAVDLFKLPQLMPMLKFCENVFDFLAKSDNNVVFMYYNTDDTLLLTMTYAYSCYYDSLPRRDLRQSIAIKSFLNSNSKILEKIPVAYRRYAWYMSLYSCMNQLQSYKASVTLYCLILYNFPTMESNKNKTSQLFFKVYTNDPLKCCHTTKLYCLPSHVNRLVIIFDQYPILLRNDTMIICYHRSLVGSKRTKILRINFHTCQVTGDILTFHSQDFEDLHPACPFKMKLDLHFQATAVFGQGEANFVCDSSHSNLSQLERFDSYESMLNNKYYHTDSSLFSTHKKTVESMVTNINKETAYHSVEANMEVRIGELVATDPCRKNESVLSSSTDVAISNRTITNEKESHNCDSPSMLPRQYNSSDQRMLLMSELMEAKREISSLKQSKNHLDMVDHGTRKSETTVISQYCQEGTIKDSTQESKSVNTSFSALRPSNERGVSFHSTQHCIHKQDFPSTDGTTTSSGYSVTLESVEKEETTKKVCSLKHQQYSESNDVFEEIETIDLKPIGKGIYDLNKGNIQLKISRATIPYGSFRGDRSNNSFTDNVGSRSTIPLRRNISLPKNSRSTIVINEDQEKPTLQTIEDLTIWWYQPNMTRDEAIGLLKHSDPGNFLVRDSINFTGAYGLAIKAAAIPAKIFHKSDDIEAEKVRHYLIEPIGNLGMHFKGFPEEPIFPSLADLVLHYTKSLSVLPCLLLLPNRSLSGTCQLESKESNENSILISSPDPKSCSIHGGTRYLVYYLGCYDVEYLTGPSIINKAIERLLANLDARKFTECQLIINPGDGIVLIDIEKKIFFKRCHSFSNIRYCCLDPRGRKIELHDCKTNGMRKTKLFGIVIINYLAGESKCFLFGELDPNQTATDIVKALVDNLRRSI